MKKWSILLLVALLVIIPLFPPKSVPWDFVWSSYGAALVEYVDPDATGAGDGDNWTDAYTSLNAWEAGEAQDLTDGGGDTMTVYCRSSGGTDDTTITQIDGWTTDSTHYIEIIGDDFPSDGVWDDTKYLIHNNDSGYYAIEIQEDFVTVRKLQVQVTSATGDRRGLRNRSQGAGAITTYDSVIVKGVCSGTDAAYGIYAQTETVKIYNCIFYDFKSGSDADFYGVICIGATVNLYNSTVYGCYRGIGESSGTLNAYNCASGNNDDDFFTVSGTVDYCCSDDGDGTNSQSPSGADWANEFNDPSNGDFSLKSGGNCVGNGTDDPSGGDYSDDIIDFSRTSTWDIGAFEYDDSAAATGQVIIIQMN